MLLQPFLLLLLSAAPQTTPLDGKPFAAEIASISPAGDVAWQGEAASVKLADVVTWGRFAETNKGPLVLLSDGGLLVADVFKADKDEITLESVPFGPVKLRVDALAGIVFRPPTARLEGDRLIDRVLQAEGDSDALVLDNGDRLTGTLESIANDELVFRGQVGEMKLPVARVVAVVFNPGLRQPATAGKNDKKGTGTSPTAVLKSQTPSGSEPVPVLSVPLRTWLGLADGSRLLVSNLTLAGKSLSFSTAGQKWSTQTRRLAALQPLGPKVVYLSDLKPTDYRHVPFLDQAWPYALDRSVTGGLPRCGGRLYAKAIGMHSAARLSFALNGPYRRFDAEAGIDDQTDGGGSVRFRVFVDERERFASEVVRGGQPPVAVSVDLSGGKRLDLVVDYADRADVLDHALWLDARLVK